MPALWGAFLFSRIWLENPAPTRSHNGVWNPAWYYFTVKRQSSCQLDFLCPKVLPPPKRGIPRLRSRNRLRSSASSVSFLLARRTPVSPAFVLFSKPNPRLESQFLSSRTRSVTTLTDESAGGPEPPTSTLWHCPTAVGFTCALGTQARAGTVESWSLEMGGWRVREIET